jgi:hypothetical protein
VKFENKKGLCNGEIQEKDGKVRLKQSVSKREKREIERLCEREGNYKRQK